jgi:hypothetical protein
MMASKLVVGTWLVACIFVANTMAVTVQLTDAQKTELLDAHNHYRHLEGASDMSKLVKDYPLLLLHIFSKVYKTCNYSIFTLASF